jgi:hypothetical protein
MLSVGECDHSLTGRECALLIFIYKDSRMISWVLSVLARGDDLHVTV